MSGFWLDFAREFRIGNDRSMAVLVTTYWRYIRTLNANPTRFLRFSSLHSVTYSPTTPSFSISSWRLPIFRLTWKMVSLTTRRSLNTASTSQTSRVMKSTSVSSNTSPLIAKVEEDRVSLSRPMVTSSMKPQRNRGGLSGARKPRAAATMASLRFQTSG